MSACYFIEPHDVLFLRGNKLFGAAGSYGESLVPPRPSVVAGAIRSALMARKGVDFVGFANSRVMDDEFGNAATPGSFRVTACHLARRGENGEVETVHPLPADLSVTKSDDGKKRVHRLAPCKLSDSLQSSAATERLAVLPEDHRGKPETSFWLNAEGWRAYLSGEVPEQAHLLARNALWQTDERIGIGLDDSKRSAAQGKLFTVQAVSLARRKQCGSHDVGILARVDGGEFPEALTLRLGGDGRAAQANLLDDSTLLNEPDWERLWQQICKHRRCRIVLTSPGIFTEGWLPAGVTETGVTGEEKILRFELDGLKAKLVCAAIPRATVISGWDLAANRPKAAQRGVPGGSVYWLEDLEATPEQLRKLANHGLWQDSENNSSRRIEGYNRFVFATY